MSPSFDHLKIAQDRQQFKPGPYPFRVRIEIPERGLGDKLNRMEEWAHARGERLPAERSDRKVDNWWRFIVYGFTDAAIADEFAKVFEGTRKPDA